jgi:hypothetical protein
MFLGLRLIPVKLHKDVPYFHLTNYSSIQVDSSGGEVHTAWAVVVFLSPSLV